MKIWFSKTHFHFLMQLSSEPIYCPKQTNLYQYSEELQEKPQVPLSHSTMNIYATCFSGF